jgi:transcriptional regulator with XRE-family HTH domain
MTLGERISAIIREQRIKQVDFAKSLGISANYVNLLANDKKTAMSHSLAKLIEEMYGYSAQWVINGGEEKFAPEVTLYNKAELIKRVRGMSDEEVRATLAFVMSLDGVRNALL